MRCTIREGGNWFFGSGVVVETEKVIYLYPYDEFIDMMFFQKGKKRGN